MHHSDNNNISVKTSKVYFIKIKRWLLTSQHQEAELYIYEYKSMSQSYFNKEVNI